jgi:hypothetical protein
MGRGDRNVPSQSKGLLVPMGISHIHTLKTHMHHSHATTYIIENDLLSLEIK